MTTYQIALSVHLLALLAATAASAIVHFAAGRRTVTPSLREALEWGKVMSAASRTFPVAVITLVATGLYMVAGRWQWQAGWVAAGMAGALTLLASGAVIGVRSAAAARASLQRLARAGHDLPNDAPPDRVAALLSEANTGIALAVVLVMTLKTGLIASLAVLAVGAAAGAYRALSRGFGHSALAGTAEVETA
ncbi:MAG TPA: hypothetical protein VGJ96_14205 [Gemmatimonadaceae bacterium]|jgi:hypothetical protein